MLIAMSFRRIHIALNVTPRPLQVSIRASLGPRGPLILRIFVLKSDFRIVLR